MIFTYQQTPQQGRRVDETMKYLIQEYHDGLLLFEVSNREVWEKAAADSVGQMKWYKKYRKKRYGKKKYGTNITNSRTYTSSHAEVSIR